MIWLAAAVVVGVGGYAGIRLAVSRLERRPDRYASALLRREPRGEKRWVVREDGTRLRVVDAGQGPPVVLAHGYGGSIVAWSVLSGRLVDRGYRVVCFDQRGHGESTIGDDGIGTAQMAADYSAVFDELDLREAVLVGHSMGGFLAIAALVSHDELSERLTGLVLMSTIAGRALKGAPQNRLQIPMIRSGLMQRITSTHTGGMLMGLTVAGDDPSPAEIKTFLDVYNNQDHRHLVAIQAAAMKEDLYPRLGEITVPTVVLCGSSDRTTPRWHAERLARSVPSARLQWVEGAGHLLNWEAPDDVVAAIEELHGGRESVG